MQQHRMKIRRKQALLSIGILYVLLIQGCVFLGQADDISIIPDDGEETDTGEEQTESGIDLFEAQAIIISNYQQSTGVRAHLYALPGHDAELYRDFAIYIYANKPATYLIKIDDQKVGEGAFEWRHIYRGQSEYNYMDVQIVVQQQGGDAQRSFDFIRIDLIDAPWKVKKPTPTEDEDEDVPEVLKPYISMGHGEFTVFILLRVVADVISAFFAVIIAIKYAAIRADMAGTQRMF